MLFSLFFIFLLHSLSNHAEAAKASRSRQQQSLLQLPASQTRTLADSHLARGARAKTPRAKAGSAGVGFVRVLAAFIAFSCFSFSVSRLNAREAGAVNA
jgi:hypothetical protein